MTKKTFAAAAGLLVLTGAFAFFVYFTFGGTYQYGDFVSVYFFNESEGRLEPEQILVPYNWELTGNELLMQAAMHFLFSEPRSSSLTRAWPDFDMVPVVRYYLNDDVLVAEFSEKYNELEPLAEALFRSALTLTMTNLPFVRSVEIRVSGSNGEQRLVARESVATIANAPMISPEMQSSQTFMLYFIDESGEGLIYKNYVAPAVNLHFRNQAILERLIENQNSPGVLPLIPQETRVLSVNEHRDALAIYVNLSIEFLTRFNGNTHEARMMIGSIVNTLFENTTLPQLRHVYFLIESGRRDNFHGLNYFDLGFSFDATLLLSYAAEDDFILDFYNDTEEWPYFIDSLD